jgi:hypothetical protein
MRDDILTFLAEVSLEFGLIGISEYYERRGVAIWLNDRDDNLFDPRADPPGREDQREEQQPDSANEPGHGRSGDGPRVSDQGEIEFYYRGWVFTKADQDPYPSTPHGDWEHQNNRWPKMDPYQGRVFKEKHQEDVGRRLRRKEMRELWGDPPLSRRWRKALDFRSAKRRQGSSLC